MKINREELRKALEVVKPGLASKELIDQTKSFAFIGDRVVTYNDEISISHPVVGLGIEGVIKADELYKLLNKLKQDEIELEITDSEITLQAGKAKAGFVLIKEVRLPLDEIGEMNKKWVSLPGNFVESVRFAIQSCSIDMSRPLLTGVHITSTCVEGSDGFRLSVHKFDQEIKIDKDLLIPAVSAKAVCNLNPIKFMFSAGWAHFQTAEGTVLSCRIFKNEDDKYPDTTRILAVTGVEIQFPKTIREILDRVAVFTKRDHFVDETINIALHEKRIVISGQSSSGWFEEVANVRYSGTELEFKITPDLLLSIVNQSTSCILCENRIKFVGEGWEYVAMLKK